MVHAAVATHTLRMCVGYICEHNSIFVKEGPKTFNIGSDTEYSMCLVSVVAPGRKSVLTLPEEGMSGDVGLAHSRNQ